MGKSSTTLKSGDNLKGRGKAFKTILFEAMRKDCMLDLPKNAKDDQVQKAFVAHAAKRAFDPDDPASHVILKEFLSKTFPGLKPTLDKVEFNFPTDGTPTTKAMAVVEAISTGVLPADVGQVVIGIIKDAVLIEESTELKERIDALEKALESNG